MPTRRLGVTLAETEDRRAPSLLGRTLEGEGSEPFWHWVNLTSDFWPPTSEERDYGPFVWYLFDTGG